MPLYEYKCTKCGKRTEKIENVKGPHLKKCPHCGGKVESVVTAPSFQFKGSGWYVTDYAGKARGGENEGKKSDSGEAKDGKESKDSKDAKGGSAGDAAAKETAAKESNEKKPAKKK